MPFTTDPFDKITEDLGLTFRPQREWIDKRGLMLISGHFFSGVGAGAWLLSLFLGFQPGLIISIILVAIAGLAHLVFLGNMMRFWRMISRPQSSWISRGLIAMSLFLLSGILYVAPAFISGLPWASDSTFGRVLLLLSLIGTAGILVYKGFVYAVIKALPFWNTPLLPALYIAYALRGGAAALIIALPFVNGHFPAERLELFKLWVVISSGVLILFYLAVMKGAGIAARKSVNDLIAGRISIAFYVGTVLFGLIIPILLGGLGYFTKLTDSLMVLVGISSLIGDFYIKYCIAKAGVYLPLIGAFPVASGVK